MLIVVFVTVGWVIVAGLFEFSPARAFDFPSAAFRFDRDLLERLVDAYTSFFHFYDDAPLLIVNATEIDLADNEAHYQALLDEILAPRTSRQYFNPNPTLL